MFCVSATVWRRTANAQRLRPMHRRQNHIAAQLQCALAPAQTYLKVKKIGLQAANCGPAQAERSFMFTSLHAQSCKLCWPCYCLRKAFTSECAIGKLGYQPGTYFCEVSADSNCAPIPIPNCVSVS